MSCPAFFSLTPITLKPAIPAFSSLGREGVTATADSLLDFVLLHAIHSPAAQPISEQQEEYSTAALKTHSCTRQDDPHHTGKVDKRDRRHARHRSPEAIRYLRLPQHR